MLLLILPRLTVSSPADPPAAPVMECLLQSWKGVHGYDNALAADVDKRKVHHLPVAAEEGEEELAASGVPSIYVSEHASDNGSELTMSISLLVRACVVCALINALTSSLFLRGRQILELLCRTTS